MDRDFLDLCKVSTKVDLQSFVESNRPNIHCFDEHNNNAYICACNYNKHPDVILYLVNDLHIDIHRVNINGNNGFLIACKDNPSLPIIKCLIEDLKIPINTVNNNHMNGFLLSCLRNSNPEIIKYLIENAGMDMNYVNQLQQNGLMIACMRNQHYSVIEYLLTLTYDINIGDVNGNTPFILACKFNLNPEIVKQLHKIPNINVSHNNHSGKNAFMIACNRSNKPIISYLMDNTTMGFEQIISKTIHVNVINHVVSSKHCFQYLIQPNLTTLKKIEIIDHLIKCNMTQYISHDYLKFTNLNEITYEQVKEYSKYIKYDIPYFMEKPNLFWNNPYFKKSIPDFFNNNNYDELFNCIFTDKTVMIYGHKVIVYNMIPIFMIMKNSQCRENKELIELKIDVNSRVFLIYLEFCYTGEFPEYIDNNDIIEFAYLVDMYPHAMLTMSDLEPYLCKSVCEKSHEFLEYICDLYELKYLKLLL